jgi:hypothetical protein
MENTALMNSEGYCVMLHLQVLSWPGAIKKTSVMLNGKSIVPTIATVYISWIEVVQRLRCEAVCFTFIATVVVVALVWRVWYQEVAC